MAQDNPNRHIVNAEDAQRLDRLSEEIRGRLAEIALIIARSSGEPYSGGAVVKFVPRQGKVASRTDVAYDWLELVEVIPGLVCCYGSIGGQTVLECPCGG